MSYRYTWNIQTGVLRQVGAKLCRTWWSWWSADNMYDMYVWFVCVCVLVFYFLFCQNMIFWLKVCEPTPEITLMVQNDFAFKIYISQFLAFPGNWTHDFAGASRNVKSCVLVEQSDWIFTSVFPVLCAISNSERTNCGCPDHPCHW